MIKVLEGFRDDVIAVCAVGRVTRQDYDTVLIPQVEATAKKHPKIRCYYEIGTDRPLFGDRDKSIHDKVEELSRERRDGYAWYNDSAKRALESYKHWLKIVPQKTSTP